MKTSYGKNYYFDENYTLEQVDRIADEMGKYIDNHRDWIKLDIGLHKHVDGQYLIDTNAITSTVYKKDAETGKFYMGYDGGHVFINDLAGLKEWLKDAGLE